MDQWDPVRLWDKGGFCPAAFSSAPLIWAARVHPYGIHTKWRMLSLMILKVLSKLNYSVFLFLEAQLPTDHHGIPPLFLHFPRKGAAGERQGGKPILNLLILLVPVNLLREVLTVQMLLGTLILCWLCVDPGRSEISLYFWEMKTWFFSAHFSSFVLIWHLTPNAIWLPFDLGPVAAYVHSQLWPSGRAQWERA